MSVTEVWRDAGAPLKGIWTNREVTGMKTVPQLLLVLGEGAGRRPVGAGGPSPGRRSHTGQGCLELARSRDQAARRGTRPGTSRGRH